MPNPITAEILSYLIINPNVNLHLAFLQAVTASNVQMSLCKKHLSKKSQASVHRSYSRVMLVRSLPPMAFGGRRDGSSLSVALAHTSYPHHTLSFDIMHRIHT